MNRSIFNLQEEYIQIASEMEAYFLESGEDELPEHIHDRLVINQNEVGEKLEKYKYLIDEWEGNIETLDKKIKSLIARKGSIAKAIERLKTYISDALDLYGQPVLKKGNPTGSVRFAGLEFTVTKIYTKPVIIDDVDDLPMQFCSYSISVNSLNFLELEAVEKAVREIQAGSIITGVAAKKREIKAAVEAGEDVTGAKIDTQASYLKFS